MKYLKRILAGCLMILLLPIVSSCNIPEETNGPTPQNTETSDVPLKEPSVPSDEDPVSEAIYQNALTHLAAKEYVEAYTLFQTIPKYRDVNVYLMRFSWRSDSTSMIDHTLPGMAMSRYDYTYDEYGRVLTENYRNHDASIVHKRSYEYDENGNLIKRGQLRSSGEWSYATWKYDSHGNVTEDLSNSSMTYRYSYTYSEDGLMLSKTERRNGSAYPSGKEEYEYDAQGRFVKVTSYSATFENKELVFKHGGFTTFFYDSFGNISHIFTSGGHYERYQYDENNRLVREEVYWGDPQADYVITYKYNEDGKLLLEEKTVKNGTHKINENVYDEQGRKIYGVIRYQSSGASKESVTEAYWTYLEDGYVQRSSYTNGTLNEWSTYQVNDQGKTVYKKVISKQYDSELWLEYDEHGNLTRRAEKRVSDMDGYPSCDEVTIYAEYRLYYDPTIVPKQEIPSCKKYPFSAMP